MIGYREPGFLWKLPLPFIWGPVGGYTQMPWAFLPAMGWRGAAYHICRNSLNGLQAKYYRRPKLAARRASAVFAATPVDREAIERFYGVPCKVIGELGCSPYPRATDEGFRRFEATLRVAWVGRAVPGKCLPLALTAVQQASKLVKLELHVVGDGAGFVQARQLADKIGITTICNWHGALPHDEALKVIDGCDCMLFSSVQDATSTVVMEALMTGLPVICHDACGFGAVIDETCGIKVPLVSPSFSKQALAGALIQLGTDSSRLTRLRQGAIARANELAWDKKAQMVVGVYSDVLTRMHGGSASQVA
jgi:glycosyltransferase involved in cell wall biosynthesis